ncbi:transmembrane protein [Capsaspora owczarzaki ATCC 30864]|uniref:Transmembrane protein n=1 Tax=Capsaspora owczarzaki (strain ATCC 30864) TaxID=595528 RepID=A0A0D2U0T6_CAPO3|nr:transmembrane protein [Capsaspora owczarzaki ATCC 30864]
MSLLSNKGTPPPPADDRATSGRAWSTNSGWRPLLLGQFLAMMLTGTAVSSQLLVSDYGVSFPTTQSLLNYLLLCVVYGAMWAYDTRRQARSASATDATAAETAPTFAVAVKRALAQRWWRYVLLAFVDVEANYLIVRAYEYTTITSVQLLDCFTIPCVMALSWYFLRVRFRPLHVLGVAICLAGIGGLFASDLGGNDTSSASNATVGDILTLCGALLYAVSNVSQEFLVKTQNRYEFLTMLGLFGTVISAVQVAIFERDELSTVGSAWQIPLLVLLFSACLFSLYSLVPTLLVLSSATFMNLSFLTADVYTLLFGLFLFGYKLSWVYFVSLALVVFGLALYNLIPVPEASPARKSRDAVEEGDSSPLLPASPAEVSPDDDDIEDVGALRV